MAGYCDWTAAMKDISAFPEIKTEYNESIHEYTNNTYSTGGMSLRDYFAAKAMQGLMCNNELPENFDGENEAAIWMAKVSYLTADAMMKARGE